MVGAGPNGVAQGAGQTQQHAISVDDSFQERRLLTFKHGDTFAVFNHAGDALQHEGGAQGIFYRDTRHLSHFQLTVDGVRPMLLSATLRDDNATLTCDLTNPDLPIPDSNETLEHDLIHIRRSRFLWNAACMERTVTRNFDRHSRRVKIEFAFAADFADVFEVRGAHRAHRGELDEPQVGNDYIKFSYLGLDQTRRETVVRFDPPPTRLSGARADFVFDLAPGASYSLFVEIACAAPWPHPSRRAYFVALRDRRRALRTASSRAAAISSSEESFNETVRRSVSDLNMLMTDTPEGPYPYAGVPWFSAAFGRDALITALQTLWLDPSIAGGVLGHLAATQATQFDPAADAEPGKILHEARYGEMAALGEVPFRRYYGAIDSTPLFIMLAGAFLDRTGDLATVLRLWPNIEAALDWMTRYGDRDGDGFIEYGRRAADGLINQGWKDSHDSIFHADGAAARGPIAVVEVQAYAYAAWRAAERIMHRAGETQRASGYGAQAEALRRRFDDAFFDEKLGSYVLALDGDKRPCRVRASNAGHALFAGIAYPERATTVARTLTGGDFFGGWGVRTLATTEARYNPMSYHNGSVWPHDNALIAAGFGRYGFRDEAAKVFEGMFAALGYIELRRLPELFCGFSRKRAQGPTSYPVACSPQAWAAATPLSMVQSCIGLEFDPDEMQITFRNPVLPSFVNDLVLCGLAIKDGSVDVALRRSGRRVLVEVLARRGPVRVVTIN
ncbi:MAG: amylo-alpha-1,6-glucosidase [Bradyrhizobium sp.]|nr:MAG: amylo-alpha-1,6-glucosidase [Bradyrhizobium sp.]